MGPARTLRTRTFFLLLVAAVVGIGWFFLSPWPEGEVRPLPWPPDAIVVLGGGDEARARRAIRLAAAFPETPVVVTGDGAAMEERLRADPVTRGRLQIETEATSTWENARFTRPLLESLGARRVALVTNWFHAPRAAAVFRRQMPGREFEVFFQPKPEPLSPWDVGCHRREKFAVLWYRMRYGIRIHQDP